ncbi:hypothetical protein C8024_16495 [Sphingopyxis sp. BSNA05]|nr:hypothetical protein [Sphingopyxis sp. BSNA05]
MADYPFTLNEISGECDDPITLMDIGERSGGFRLCRSDRNPCPDASGDSCTCPEKFTTSPDDAVANRDLALAQDMVAKSLSERGYESSPDASILLHVALSNRPADIAVDAGAENAEQSISAAKKQKTFQSCKDREHRLTVSLFDQVRGKNSIPAALQNIIARAR